MKILSRGHPVQELEPAVKEKYDKDFAGSIKNFVKIQPGGWMLPSAYLKYEKLLFDFKFRHDDVVVMTYPKCGTTWMQEIVWTMRNNPNLDNSAAGDPIFSRSPFIDGDMLIPDKLPEGDTAVTNPEGDEAATTPEGNPLFGGFFQHCPDKDPNNGVMIQVANAVSSPRTLKTHLPFSLLDKSMLDTCKVVYVARNPKDKILSYLHNCRLINLHGFTGSQDEFVDYFVNDMVLYGSYAEHLKEAWQLRHHPNLLWVFYEDLKKDTLGQLRRLDAFMGTELTEAQLLNVQQHTSFSNMKATDPAKMEESPYMNMEVKKKDGGLLRLGQAGSWKGKYTAEQERKIDDWIKRNFDGHGLQFTYY